MTRERAKTITYWVTTVFGPASRRLAGSTRATRVPMPEQTRDFAASGVSWLPL